MPTINLAETERFIKGSQKFNIPKRESSFFDVGLRGHYENPTTELLCFFLDPNKEHGLGELFIHGFLAAVGHLPEAAGEFISAEREVTTNYGRIDLLLIFERTVITVECKINHHVNNPFEDYQEFIEEKYRNKERLYVLLSPEGKDHKNQQSPTTWQGLSYDQLAASIKKEWQGARAGQPNKWHTLANELLLQFHNYGNVKMNDDQFDFVFSNFEQIENIKRLQQIFYDKILERVKAESKFDDVAIKQENWNGAPALRFKREIGSGPHGCVIYFSNNKENPWMARVWSNKKHANAFVEKLKPKLKELNIKMPMRDTEGNLSRWDWYFSDMDLTIKLIAKFLEALDENEKSQP